MSDFRQWHPWESASQAAEALQITMSDLRTNSETAIDCLRSALTDFSARDPALTVLGILSTDYTVKLIDDLVVVALRTRYTLQIRNLLGRLAYQQAEALVPLAVWRLLEAESDGDAYRRMAELLDHLGLKDALDQLFIQARNSIDEDAREMAEDFSS